jgi:DNA-binding PucR family transcriptional regulator
LQKAGLVLSAFPAECITKIGVSLPFTDISTLKAHYDEAHDALELGQMLDPDLSIYTFEDYGIYAMFRTVSKTENLSRYLHPALPILSDYDSRNGTQLELTLYTYLKCACSTTETADTLFLHRNSVIYRLHRIEDLCDIDLSDTDTGFRLRLSFAISYVINQRRTWSGKAPVAE